MKDWTELDRREFLAALGASFGSAACVSAAPRSWFLEYAGGDDGSPVERFVNTLCPMCPGGCGLTMRMVHGCAVGVRGNKDHPINRGGLCSRASAILQDLYNPDRLQHPLRCVGTRGSGKWEQITWDVALDMVADNLGMLRAKGDAHRLCVVLGRDRGLTRMAWQRFARAFGTPNVVDAHPDDNLGVLPAVLATHGVRQRIGYDVGKAAFVLSFSSAWLDAHWSMEQAARAFGNFRRGRPGYRPRWVHIEPRYSLTATKADEWLPIRPGTEGTLALGIAHVIIREGLYDRDFIAQHAHGFEDWVDRQGREHLGFRRMVLQDYTPIKVQAVTDVEEGAIFRLGREFSRNRPALAIGFDGGGCGAQSAYDRMAVHCLNGLVGSIDVPGGVTVFQAFGILEDDSDVDEIAARGLAMPSLDGPSAGRRLSDSSIDRLGESMATGRPYPTEALVLVDADPVFSLAEGTRFGAALSGVPFVVALSGYHNDSSRHADLILPSLHSLHCWDFNVAHTLKGHPVVTLSQPVMPPPPDAHDAYRAVRAIAERLGGAMPGALPWIDGKTAVEAGCRELFSAGKGAAFGPAKEESWTQLLESRGWRAPFAENFEDFKRDVQAGGGWTDPMYFHGEWDRVFRSPPSKFSFSSSYLSHSFQALPEPGSPLTFRTDEARGDSPGDSRNLQGESADHDRRCLPCCRIDERRHDGTYPLELYVYPLPNLVGVASPNLPWLNDIAGAYMFQKWRTWVEIHPKTAKHYGIVEGDKVLVQTPRGRLTLAAKVYSGLLPEVIAVPFGFGHKSGGRWCARIGEHPADLVDARTDPLTGVSLWSSTRAEIQKV